MALYTILFFMSIFLIVLVITIIKKVFFRLKEEHIIETQLSSKVSVTPRPACGMMIYMDKCLLKRREYASDIAVYDVITKTDNSELGDNLDGSI